MLYAVRFLGVIVCAVLLFLAGWTASAAEVAKSGDERVAESLPAKSSRSRESFDSLLGETQIATSGVVSYSDSSDFFWQAGVSGLHYIAPRFGVGGRFSLSDSSYNDQSLYYSIGPTAEYFVPVSDRGHVFTQASFLVSGGLGTESELRLGIDLGYRYFVADNMALSVQLNKNWAKTNVSSSTLRSDGVNLNYGFSLFF